MATVGATTVADGAHSTWLTPLELAVLGAIWGGSFLFMRIAAPAFGPVPLVEARLALGGLILLPLLWRTTLTGAQWLRLTAIAAINNALPFVLFAWGAERAPAGIGAISNSMAALFVVLVAFLLYREPIGLRRGIGLALGFVGVVVLASGRMGGSSVWPAALAGTTAALCYGFGVNWVRRHLSGVPAGTVAAASLLGASVLLAPFAFVTWPAQVPSVRAWLSALALGCVCTGLAYVLFYRLIHRIGASRAAMVTYVVPLFGVVWANVVLGEPITMTMAASGALILGGVFLSQQTPRS
jgi:drug/metabolite transporter (DMT)-like permease